MAEIDRATEGDVPAIQEVLRETWQDTYAQVLPQAAIEAITSQWHAQELLAEQVQNPEVYFAIARDDDSVVGVISARKQDDAIVVGRLYVRPRYQRRGIGRQLLESSYRAFVAVRRARLSVEVGNRKGVAFYAKEGFRETARSSEDVAGTSLEIMAMEKAL